MYTLRLLGTASIDAPDGVMAGRAAQGRRLALLALLALARGRALTRDELVALLWPEATSEGARAQLSDTLNIVRRALGEDAVRPVGDGLALNADVIATDVDRFETLRSAGRMEEAVALYGGPLLDGFHVPDSPEFETWLERERVQLARHYGHALECLAEAATEQGAHAAAVDWWRRRALLDPLNSAVALRLMHALEAAGDRPGAIQHARIHAALLRDQLDADPDADVAAFAERLRLMPPAEPPPAAPDRSSFSAIRSPPSTPVVAAEAPAASAPVVAAEPPAASAPVVAAEPPAASSSAPVTGSLSPRRVAAAAGVLVLALALGTVWGITRDGTTDAPRSIGVLPFVNVSADPDYAYFSDGISEQIILGLSRIDGLRVAARTSSFALRNRELDVRAIGDTLDVEAVLEGSVLVSGERLRVIAQLIDARTGFHIWANQYEGELRDAFALEDSIASAIAAALRLRLATPHGPAAAPSLAAYDLYLRGLQLRNSLSADALRQASELFDRAIEMEPRFALAWAAKASVTAPQAFFRYAPRDSVVAELRRLTERALELDPALGEAYVSLGALKLFYDWDWHAAGKALRRAVELNPNDALAWHHLANYHIAVGSTAEAIAARERAVQLDPLNPRTRMVLSRDYMIAGQYDRALEQARRAAQFDPAHPLLLGTGGALPVGPAPVFLRQGRHEEALEEYIRVAALRGATAKEMQDMRDAYARAGMPAFWRSWLEMDLRQSGPLPDPVRMSATHMMMGDTAGALDWLDRAFADRSPSLIYLRQDAAFHDMAWHPRVARVVRAMNFPD